LLAKKGTYLLAKKGDLLDRGDGDLFARSEGGRWGLSVHQIDNCDGQRLGR
jgi:hypothetical protein